MVSKRVGVNLIIFIVLTAVLAISAIGITATRRSSDIRSKALEPTPILPTQTVTLDTFDRYKTEVEMAPSDKSPDRILPNAIEPDFVTVTPLTRTDIDATITKKVMVIIFNPILETHGNQRLSTVLNWYDPTILATNYILSLMQLTDGAVRYQIASQQVIDAIPVKKDGFQYTDATYMNCWNDHSTCHSPDLVNYNKILIDADACTKRNNGTIDEVWIFGGPWFGYWESTLYGPNVFFYNDETHDQTGLNCTKQLPVMGFNYERKMPLMLHSLGHRVEAVMRHMNGDVWNRSRSNRSTWDLFTTRVIDPAPIGCGSVHFPPNASKDYDYNLTTPVVNSNCDDWLNYPNLTGTTKQTSCNLIWGCDTWWADESHFIPWWLHHIPHYLGRLNSIWNNWWKYILDYEGSSVAPTCATPAAPTNLNFTCSADKTSATIFWNSGANTAYSSVRINNTSDSWAGNCIPTASGDRCADTPRTSLTVPVTPGQTYSVWVHGRNLCDQYGSSTAANINCVLPSPTPIPSLSPTPAQTWKRSDIVSNGKVDIFDYSALVGEFGKSETSQCARSWNIADIISDCKVDIFDYNALVGDFGKS